MVINKALPNLNFPDLQQQVEKIDNVPVAGILPLSEEMVQLASKGLFSLRYPEHPISKTIKGITEQIAGLVVTC